MSGNNSQGYRLEQGLGHWAARLSWALRGAMETLLKPLGLTPPMMAALLAVDGGAERAADLAQVMGVDAAAITRLMERMGEAGLVSRCELKGDRRSRRISLSDKARGLLPRLRAAAAELDQEMGKGLGPQELAALKERMQALAAKAERL